MTTFAHGQLRAFIERIERLEEEKKAIAADIKEIYAEAKANGFDTKIMRAVVALRKKDANERQETQALIDVYMDALGMNVEHEEMGAGSSFMGAGGPPTHGTGDAVPALRQAASSLPAKSPDPAPPIHEPQAVVPPMVPPAQAAGDELAMLPAADNPEREATGEAGEGGESPPAADLDVPDLPDFLKRNKPTYTAEQLLGAG